MDKIIPKVAGRILSIFLFPGAIEQSTALYPHIPKLTELTGKEKITDIIVADITAKNG